MRLNRFVIGVSFSERMFRVPSLSGILTDELLKLRNNSKLLNPDYFSKVINRRTSDSVIDYALSLANEDTTNELVISAEQFILKKTSSTDTASVNKAKVISEFQELWKAADKIVEFGAVRRIGFAGEYRIPLNDRKNTLIGLLTNFSNNNDLTTRFKMEFENRSFTEGGFEPSPHSDNYINIIRNFYLSDLDETPVDGFLNANIDVQEYYNPTKTNPLKQLNHHLDIYQKHKTTFKDELSGLGLI